MMYKSACLLIEWCKKKENGERERERGRQSERGREGRGGGKLTHSSPLGNLVF